jgi:hypothetical protein
MPSYQAHKLCRCSACLSHNPNGLWQSRSRFTAHQVPFTVGESPESFPLDIEAAHSYAIALAMTDNGPDLDGPSRSWSSYSENQANIPSTSHSSMTTGSIDKVLATVHRVLGDDAAPPVHNPLSPTIDRLLPSRCTHQMLQCSRVLENIEKWIPILHGNLEQACSAPQIKSCIKELSDLCSRLEELNTRSDEHLTVMKKRLLKELENLTCTFAPRLLATRAASEADNRPLELNTDHHFRSPIDDASEVVQVSTFLIVFCCVVAGVSRRIGDFILGVISIILRLTLPTNDTAVPTSVRTVLSRFNLDGQTTLYAVCPACHCTYKPRTSTPIYPSNCSNCPRPGRPICGKNLLEQSHDSTAKPIKVFMYHHFHDYLARLLARPDIEDVMDGRCDELMVSLTAMNLDDTDTGPSCTSQDYMKDIFEAEFISTFREPLGVQLFVDRPGTEGRYFFALNLDFFPPEGMSVRGAKISVGLLSMACLNLPLDLRYKAENLYIASIIPGPREPSLTQLNHYICPLVDDLYMSWTKGVRFSCTALEPDGRFTCSVIATCICDLQAARKLSQTSAPRSHYFCTVCHCCDLSTLG